MVKAMDFRSDGGFACRFDSLHKDFFPFDFYDDDGGATHRGADKRKACVSTSRNERRECRR